MALLAQRASSSVRGTPFACSSREDAVVTQEASLTAKHQELYIQRKAPALNPRRLSLVSPFFGLCGSFKKKRSAKCRTQMVVATPSKSSDIATPPPEDVLYDAIIVGSGMGGLVTATQLAAKGANVLLLEKYIIPGGSAGYFEREGYTFDVGSSMMFGFGDQVWCLLVLVILTFLPLYLL